MALTLYIFQQLDTFGVYSKTMCSYVTELRLHLIECNHNRKPAWAQNDAMMEAYLDDVDFYYRVSNNCHFIAFHIEHCNVSEFTHWEYFF